MAETGLIDIIKRHGMRRLDAPVELACGAMSSEFIDGKLALCRWDDLQMACQAIVERVHGAGIEFQRCWGDDHGGRSAGGGHRLGGR